MLVMFRVSAYHRLNTERPKFVQLAGSFFEWGSYSVQPTTRSDMNLRFQKCVRSELGSALGFALEGAVIFFGLAE